MWNSELSPGAALPVGDSKLGYEASSTFGDVLEFIHCAWAGLINAQSPSLHNWVLNCAGSREFGNQIPKDGMKFNELTHWPRDACWLNKSTVCWLNLLETVT
jgi:hypothetical protein